MPWPGMIKGGPMVLLGWAVPLMAICQPPSVSTDFGLLLPSYPRFPTWSSAHFSMLRPPTPVEPSLSCLCPLPNQTCQVVHPTLDAVPFSKKVASRNWFHSQRHFTRVPLPSRVIQVLFNIKGL